MVSFFRKLWLNSQPSVIKPGPEDPKGVTIKQVDLYFIIIVETKKHFLSNFFQFFAYILQHFDFYRHNSNIQF